MLSKDFNRILNSSRKYFAVVVEVQLKINDIALKSPSEGQIKIGTQKFYTGWTSCHALGQPLPANLRKNIKIVQNWA